MQVAGGRVLLELEGGYNLTTLQDCSEYCVRALLGDSVEPVNAAEWRRAPNESAVRTLQAVIETHRHYWRSFRQESRGPLSPMEAARCSEYEYLRRQNMATDGTPTSSVTIFPPAPDASASASAAAAYGVPEMTASLASKLTTKTFSTDNLRVSDYS